MTTQLKAQFFECDPFDGRIVHIRKIVKPSAQGRHKHTRNGKPIHKTQAGKASTTWKIPDLDKTSVLNTGLWKTTKNPFYIPTTKDAEGKETKGEALENLPANYAGQGIETAKVITWQTLFEIRHNKPLGFYSSERWTMADKTKESRRTFLQGFSYVLLDGATTLKLDNPKDQLMYFFAKNSIGYFAQNEQDSKMKPRVMFYLSEVDEPEEAKREKLKLREDALYNFGDLKRKFTEEMSVKFATILNLVRGKVSPNLAMNMMSETLTGEDNKSRDLIRKFNSLYELLNSDNGRSKVDAQYTLQKYLNVSILTNSGDTYRWTSKKDTELEVLAKSREKMLAWLLDADKVDYHEMLREEYELKTTTL